MRHWQRWWAEARRNPRENRALTTLLLLGATAGLLFQPPVRHYADSLLLGRFPYADPERLVVLTETTRVGNAVGVRPLTFARWRDESHAASSLALYGYRDLRWRENAQDRRVAGARVTDRFFTTLGVNASQGRLFHPDDFRTGAAPVVVLTHAFWRDRLQADPQVLQRSLNLNGQPHRIVGVLPPEFWFVIRKAELWTPVAVEQPRQPGDPWRGVVARLRPGASLNTLRTETLQASGWLGVEWPWAYRRRGVQALPLRWSLLPDLAMAVLLLLFPLLWSIFRGTSRLVEDWTREKTPALPLRFWSFYFAKLVLIVAALLVLWVHLIDGPVPWLLQHGVPSWVVQSLLGMAFFTLGYGLNWWAWRDQQYRCRVCLTMLRMPVQSGSFASLLLNRPDQEYICPLGHGHLTVPGALPADAGELTWTHSRPMWEELSKQE